MKHVIVIETNDSPDGTLTPITRRLLEDTVEHILDQRCILACVRCSFNRPSAIAAVHEIYGAPEWKGGL